EGPDDQSLRLERGHVHRAISVEAFEVADVHDGVMLLPGRMAEAALGQPAEERHLAAFEQSARQPGSCAGVLALVAEPSRLALSRADAPTDAALEFPLRDAR